MRRQLVLLIMSAALVATACGSGSGGPAPREALAQAASTTADAGSARVAFDARIEPPSESGQDPVTFSGEGEFDYEDQLGRMTFDMSELLGLQSAQVNPEQARIEAIFDDLVLYMKVPAMQQMLPEAKPWVKLDLEAMGGKVGANLGQFSQFGQQGDPTQQLEVLRGVSDDVEEVGRQEVRGEATTHYEMTIDLEKVAEEVPESSRAQFEDLIEAAGSKEIPAEAWLDDEGRVRRIRYDYEAEVPGAAGAPQKTRTTVTMELFDFGTQVNVELPPADEVTDLARFLKSRGGG
jgi:hypothetical protein